MFYNRSYLYITVSSTGKNFQVQPSITVNLPMNYIFKLQIIILILSWYLAQVCFKLQILPSSTPECLDSRHVPLPLDVLNYFIYFLLEYLKNILNLCVWVFCLYICLFSICVPCLWRPEEGVELIRTGVIDRWKLPHGCWESDLGPLKNHSVILTAVPSLQASSKLF